MASRPPRIGFITDTEGNWEYWCKCVEISDVVAFDHEGHLQFRQPGEEDRFVFGGDVFDKGSGDIRIATELVRFKDAHPNRVFLLAGNRDLNKVRFTAELAEDEIDVPQPVPLYPRAPPQVALRDFLAQRAKDGDVEAQNSKANRLRWILDHTMTAKGAFELRRQELQLLRGEGGGEVHDDDVVRSFLESVESEGGFVWQYLDRAQLMVTLGDTLFVHGGVPKGAAGMLPPPSIRYQTPPEGADCGFTALPEGHSVQDWVDAMNGYYRDALHDYRAQMLWRADGSRSRGGEALMALTSSPAFFQRSVVVESLLEAGTPLPVDPATEEYLARGGIQRVVSGHKPCGDSPFVVRGRVEFLLCDTTYSDSQAKDSRGAAYAATEVELGAEGSRSLLRGVLRDERRFNFSLPKAGCSGEDGSDDVVGCVTTEGHWVKALVDDGSYHLAYSQKGDRKVFYERMDREALLGVVLQPRAEGA